MSPMILTVISCPYQWVPLDKYVPPMQEHIRLSYYDADEIYILVSEQLGAPLHKAKPLSRLSLEQSR